MYGRSYKGKDLNFEASGGLMHASLVMIDKETESFWPIMAGRSIAGELSGTSLEEVTHGVKVTWSEWVKEHPSTTILSVGGEEHVDQNPYENYFKSDEGFRGVTASDERLPTKASIYAFHRNGEAYAVPFSSFEGGAAFPLREEMIFLYRPEGAEIFASTLAFVAPESAFKEGKGGWIHLPTGARFDAETGSFAGKTEASVESLGGFDTFWFNWSMNNPQTQLVGVAKDGD